MFLYILRLFLIRVIALTFLFDLEGCVLFVANIIIPGAGVMVDMPSADGTVVQVFTPTLRVFSSLLLFNVLDTHTFAQPLPLSHSV